MQAFSRRKVDVATHLDLVFFYDGMVTASGDDFQRRVLEEVGGTDGLLSEYTGHGSAFVADTSLPVSCSHSCVCCPCTTQPCTESALVCAGLSSVPHVRADRVRVPQTRAWAPRSRLLGSAESWAADNFQPRNWQQRQGRWNLLARGDAAGLREVAAAIEGYD